MSTTTTLLPAVLLALLASSEPLRAADFTFFATLRAGRPGGGDWEMGLGSTTVASDVTGSVLWSNGQPHWRDGGLPQDFEIGYRAATQSAYLTVWNSARQQQTIQFANTGTPLGPTATWTLPSANFFTSASVTNQPSSITLENLRFSAGVQVLSGILPASLGASQPAPSANNLAAPLVIDPTANGGTWAIAGTIRFSGLSGSGGTARGSALQFMMGAAGADTPEVSTSLSAGLGFAALGFAALLRRIR